MLFEHGSKPARILTLSNKFMHLIIFFYGRSDNFSLGVNKKNLYWKCWVTARSQGFKPSSDGLGSQ